MKGTGSRSLIDTAASAILVQAHSPSTRYGTKSRINSSECFSRDSMKPQQSVSMATWNRNSVGETGPIHVSRSASFETRIRDLAPIQEHSW